MESVLDNLKWAMPVLMVHANVENRLVDERGDVQAGDRLHQVGGSSLVPSWPKMGAHHQRSRFGSLCAAWPE